MSQKVVALFARDHWSPPVVFRRPGTGIRPYLEGDREAVRRICCDTAFLGRPIDPIFCDRELYADLMTGPYLDHEPESALVIEKEGRVIGYLLASTSRSFGFRQLRHTIGIGCRMLARLAAGRYDHHPRSRRFVRWVLTAAARERPRRPPGGAVLHWNLEDFQRGRFLAHRFWTVLERRLAAGGVTEFSAEFFSHPRRRPELLYHRCGFSLYDQRQTSIFQPEIEEPVHLVCLRRGGPGKAAAPGRQEEA